MKTLQSVSQVVLVRVQIFANKVNVKATDLKSLPITNFHYKSKANLTVDEIL